MNKKGFTLVEILVSIGLLALLGSVIAISLNKVFKNNNIKNYNEYVEKIKSSAMLYVNNTVDIINDLNGDYQNTIIKKVKNLIIPSIRIQKVIMYNIQNDFIIEGMKFYLFLLHLYCTKIPYIYPCLVQ